MKFDIEKKKLIKESVIAASVLFVAFSIYGFVSYYTGTMESDIQDAENAKMQAIRTTLKEEEAYKNIVESFEVYKAIPTSKLPHPDGLANAASRIRTARPVIEEFKKQYFISNVDVTFSNVDEIPAENGNSVGIVTNRITIEMDTLTDELFLSFLHRLIKDFPGYLTIEQMDVRRDVPLTPEIITRIKRGDKPSLVNGEVRLLWKVLKGSPEQSDTGNGEIGAQG